MNRRFIVSYIGIYYMLLASLSFAFTGAFAKLLSVHMSSVEVVFFRNFIGFIMITYIILKNPLSQKGGHFFLLVFRGVIGVLALLAFFYNIAHISLGAAFTFSKTAPIFTAVLAYFILKERLSLLGWVAIFVGFVGILFIMQPNLAFSKSDYLGVFSGLGGAMAYTSIRELRKFYDTKAIVLSFVGFGSLVPFCFMVMAEFVSIKELDFFMAKFVMPDLKSWIYIAFMGISGTMFQIYMTKAYAASKKAAVVAAISYSDIIFSVIIGVILGDDLPTFMMAFGMGLIILSAVLIAKER